MMDDHRIPLEELRERYQTDYTKGLSSAKAQQLNQEFGKEQFEIILIRLSFFNR